MITIEYYKTEMGRVPFKTFLSGIKNPEAKSMVAKSINKMEKGLPGKVASVGDGVKEYKINVGKGYRIYFYNDGQEIIVLLGGSTKGDQDKEIEKAKECLKDYKRQKASARKALK